MLTPVLRISDNLLNLMVFYSWKSQYIMRMSYAFGLSTNVRLYWGEDETI